MTDKTVEQLKAKWLVADAAYEATCDACDAAYEAAYDAAKKAEAAYLKALAAQEKTND